MLAFRGVHIDFLEDTTVCNGLIISLGFAEIFSISHVCSFTGAYFSESWHGTWISGSHVSATFVGTLEFAICVAEMVGITFNIRLKNMLKWSFLYNLVLMMFEQQRSSETSNLKHPQKPGLESWRKKLWGIRIQSYNHLLGFNHRKALLPSNFCGVKKPSRISCFPPENSRKCQLFTGDVWLAVIVTCVVVVVITGRWFLLVNFGGGPIDDRFHLISYWSEQLPPNTLVICFV